MMRGIRSYRQRTVVAFNKLKTSYFYFLMKLMYKLEKVKYAYPSNKTVIILFLTKNPKGSIIF
jgi:hypothetical protein